MNSMSNNGFPGDEASPWQVKLLADEYHSAALLLFGEWKARNPLSQAPYRMVAIHAIELYLNALLNDRGFKVSRIRGMHHNLGERAALAMESGLRLKAKTIAHLSEMSSKREYMVTRYGPEMTEISSHLTRISSSLQDVAEKVSAAITAPADAPAAAHGAGQAGGAAQAAA